MAERYTKLFSLPENLYQKDCPVLICAGALSKDNQTNRVFSQLRFQNIDSRHRRIVAIKVAIQAFDVAEKTLGEAKEYQYLDINIDRGAEVGSRQPVYLDDITARSFSVSVLKVVFENGEIWTGSAQNWYSLQQTKLRDTFNADLVEQYQRDTFAEAQYEPFVKDDIWMCACGALNVIEDDACCRCHTEKARQFTALDHNTLETHLDNFAEEELTKKRIEDAEVQKKLKKKIIIGSIVAIIVCLCIALPQVIKNAKYKPYVKEIVGTTWGNNEYIAWDKRSRDEWSGQYWEFTSDKSAVQADWSNNWTTSTHDDYYTYNYVSWKILGISKRRYNVDGVDFSGDAMRIRVGDSKVGVYEMDVWIINDTPVIIRDPDKSNSCILYKYQ